MILLKIQDNGVMIGSVSLTDLQIARISWILPAITVPIAMIIHLISGNARTFPIFISEADYPGLERWIFTIGLCLAGLIQMVFAYRMWASMKHTARRKLMHLTLLCGFFTGGNLVIMSFANMYEHLALHVLTASNVFQGGMLWALLAHFSLPNADAKGRKIRLVGMFISLISYVVMTQSVIRAVKDLEKYGLEQDTIFTLNSIQSAVDVAAIAEYGLFIGLITALYSFEFDFGKKSEESE